MRYSLTGDFPGLLKFTFTLRSCQAVDDPCGDVSYNFVDANFAMADNIIASVGVVTMDQLMLDVGEGARRTGSDVAVGDEVVLIGEQAGERIRAEEWADLLDTIGYEIVCGVSGRVRRSHRPDRP